MSITQLNPEKVAAILDGLFDREATITPLDSPKPLAAPTVVATFIDIEGNLHYIMEAELSITNSMGAALTMIPAGMAADSTKEGIIPDNIADNAKEVFNICSAFFADFHNQRILLDKVFLPGEEIAEDLTTKISAATLLLQAEYEIQSYPAGVLSLSKIES